MGKLAPGLIFSTIFQPGYQLCEPGRWLILAFLSSAISASKFAFVGKEQRIVPKASRSAPRKARFPRKLRKRLLNTLTHQSQNTPEPAGSPGFGNSFHFLRTLSLLASSSQSRLAYRAEITPGRPSKASISIPLSSARNQPSEGPASRSPSAFNSEFLERRFGFLHFRHASNLVRPFNGNRQTRLFQSWFATREAYERCPRLVDCVHKNPWISCLRLIFFDWFQNAIFIQTRTRQGILTLEELKYR